MPLHTNKPGIRALGVAESFRPGQRRSLVAGVVMRRDLVVDGVAFAATSVGGDDATSVIAKLFRNFRRNDINVLLVSGAILSLYNMVDVDALSSRIGTPVICLTYRETAGIEGSIRRHFTDPATKLAAYKKLGPRRLVRLANGRRVYARSSGIDTETAKKILDVFTLQGSVPEPVKLARLLARAGQSVPRPI